MHVLSRCADKLTSLQLHYSRVTQAGCEPLDAFSHLSVFTLSQLIPSLVATEMYSRLCQLPLLRTLRLVNVDSDSLHGLFQMTSVTDLDITNSRTPISDHDAAQVAALRELKDLSLPVPATTRGLASLTSLRSLKRLALRPVSSSAPEERPIPSEWLAKCFTKGSLPNLEYLELPHLANVAESMVSLVNLHSLKRVKLYDSLNTAQGQVLVSKLPLLEHFEHGHNSRLRRTQVVRSL